MKMTVCVMCGRAVYWQGKTDSVGRQTSEGEWTHYGEADHAAIPVERNYG